MKRFVLLTEKSWHAELFQNLSSRKDEEWILIDSKDNFTKEKLGEFKPSKVFIPHWSYIIPEDIFERFECIVFHMTDLPYGRGGSPLQNLIVRGHTITKISALRVDNGIDTGDIYLKKELGLSGTAHEIFERTVPIIESMINEIIDKNLEPTPQTGQPVLFKRRKPVDSNLKDLAQLKDVYDYIRMLDAPGYPKAFLETNHLKIEFTEASASEEGQIIANVRITKK